MREYSSFAPEHVQWREPRRPAGRGRAALAFRRLSGIAFKVCVFPPASALATRARGSLQYNACEQGTLQEVNRTTAGVSHADTQADYGLSGEQAGAAGACPLRVGQEQN